MDAELPLMRLCCVVLYERVEPSTLNTAEASFQRWGEPLFFTASPFTHHQRQGECTSEHLIKIKLIKKARRIIFTDRKSVV